MKKNNTLFYSSLIFFGLIVIISVSLIIRANKNPNHKIILDKNVEPGIFQITAKDEVEVNSSFFVEFSADSNKQNVNAVALEVTYNPDHVEILNVDTSQSFCQFYPENKFNNGQGSLSIQCGAPSPGFKGKNIIARVKFFAKNIGQSEITITDKSQILLNDGKATNIFAQPSTHTFSIQNRI